MNQDQFFKWFEGRFGQLLEDIKYEFRWHRDWLMPRINEMAESKHIGTRKHVDNAASRENGITRAELGAKLDEVLAKLNEKA